MNKEQTKQNSSISVAEPVKPTKMRMNVRKMVFIALFGALSAVLMSLNFKLPFMPPFLKFDVADFPALFAGFYLGPVAGVFVIVIKIALELLLTGTETAFVGELTNLLASLMFVLPASLIYKFSKTKKSALISLIVSTVFVSVVNVFLNLFISLPMYVNLYHMPMDEIIDMCRSGMPLIKNEFTLLMFGVLPFNLIKYGATSIVTFLIYKRLGKLFGKILRI